MVCHNLRRIKCGRVNAKCKYHIQVWDLIFRLCGYSVICVERRQTIVNEVKGRLIRDSLGCETWCPICRLQQFTAATDLSPALTWRTCCTWSDLDCGPKRYWPRENYGTFRAPFFFWCQDRCCRLISFSAGRTHAQTHTRTHSHFHLGLEDIQSEKALPDILTFLSISSAASLCGDRFCCPQSRQQEPAWRSLSPFCSVSGLNYLWGIFRCTRDTWDEIPENEGSNLSLLQKQTRKVLLCHGVSRKSDNMLSCQPRIWWSFQTRKQEKKFLSQSRFERWYHRCIGGWDPACPETPLVLWWSQNALAHCCRNFAFIIYKKRWNSWLMKPLEAQIYEKVSAWQTVPAPLCSSKRPFIVAGENDLRAVGYYVRWQTMCLHFVHGHRSQRKCSLSFTTDKLS